MPFTASAINSLRHETRLPHPAPYVQALSLLLAWAVLFYSTMIDEM